MPDLVVIFGPPASGKAAIGHELAALTGYRFFHNHLTADPVAALFGWESERFSPMVDAIRRVWCPPQLHFASANTFRCNTIEATAATACREAEFSFSIILNVL